MALELRKAQRSKAYLKLGLSAPSGGGKTLGALLIAYGLMKEKYPKATDAERWSKIAIIDTENGSGELYVGKEISGIKIGVYDAVTLHAPFEADKYTEAIALCKDSNIEVCIIDSTTHLWSGEGGLLEQQNAAAKRGGNSYTAWRDITPQHNRFVNAMLQTPIHIIATMRAKQEYVQEKDSTTNKTTVRKLGLEPEQRKGMEYEFTTFLDIDAEHTAFGSKDRTSLYDQKYFKITPEIGTVMMKWLESGVDNAPEVVAVSVHPAEKKSAMTEVEDDIINRCRALGGSKNEALMALVMKYAPNKNPKSIKDEAKLAELRSEIIEFEKATAPTAA
jgi:hypothetical protein